jgi:hypothetical protein
MTSRLVVQRGCSRLISRSFSFRGHRNLSGIRLHELVGLDAVQLFAHLKRDRMIRIKR